MNGTTTPLLRMRGIYKSFGGGLALDNVHLTVGRGEIHALMGENGAGKSTLMNVLAGVISVDAGSIEFDGKHYPHPTIARMEDAGIAFVHQEISVINDLRVFENIFLNREIRNAFGILDSKAMVAKTRELFAHLGVEMDPLAMVSELRTGEKQLLAICRALHMNAKLLILDEPTTALNNAEIDHFFGILQKLKKAGTSFIFISHKMPEVFAIADRYTVFRNGKFVCEGAIADTTSRQMTSAMIGTEYAETDVYQPRPLGEELLCVTNLAGEGFEEVSFTVKKGEIVAFTGLAGSGAGELLQTLFGALPVHGGTLELSGKPLHGDIVQFMKRGVAMLPSNRMENSVIPDMSVLENFQIAAHRLSRDPVIHSRQEEASFARYKDALHIKAKSQHGAITSLSGGNQQKVFLARWLHTDASVLLFDNPTQGVDVGAKAEIYQLILRLAEGGKTILLNTQEIAEIKKVADRCLVMYDGRMVATLANAQIDEQTVMMYATNAVQIAGKETVS